MCLVMLVILILQVRKLRLGEAVALTEAGFGPRELTRNPVLLPSQLFGTLNGVCAFYVRCLSFSMCTKRVQLVWTRGLCLIVHF
jgi:hypothetical protein